MDRIRNFITFCTILLLCTACATEDNKNESLQMALKMVDSNPQEALQLLDKISDPELLNLNSYMQYITALTQSRFMNDQDITGDSIILNAQRHFVNISNYEMAARASYYSSGYWHEKDNVEKALEYALLAHYFAQLAENQLFKAKSTHWIGSIYYNKEELDSARIYYLQALEEYTNEANTELYQLDLIYMLCRTNLELEEFDQVLDYSNNGIKMARKLGDDSYEVRLMHIKGIALREMKDYPQAKEYFNLALAKKTNAEDSLVIYISYARQYREINQSDSAKYYLDLVKNRVEELSYPYNRLLAFQELLLYYVKEGNEKQVKHYLTLIEKEDQKIDKIQDKADVQLVYERFGQQIKAERKTSRLNILYIICVAVVLLLLGWRYFRKQKAKLNNRYEKLRDKHLFQGLDLNRVLINGLRSIAKSMDLLNQEKKTRLALLTSVGEEFQMLRETFNSELAELAGKMLKQFPNGAAALRKLNKDELCILRLTQMKHSDKAIGWMLGLKVNLEDYVLARKSRIRQTMAESGMSEQDIRLLFTPIIKI